MNIAPFGAIASATENFFLIIFLSFTKQSVDFNHNKFICLIGVKHSFSQNVEMLISFYKAIRSYSWEFPNFKFLVMKLFYKTGGLGGKRLSILWVI